MKYLDLHLKENLIRQTSFLPKKTPPRSLRSKRVRLDLQLIVVDYYDVKPSLLEKTTYNFWSVLMAVLSSFYSLYLVLDIYNLDGGASKYRAATECRKGWNSFWSITIKTSHWVIKNPNCPEVNSLNFCTHSNCTFVNNYKYVEILNKANIITRIATLMNVLWHLREECDFSQLFESHCGFRATVVDSRKWYLWEPLDFPRSSRTELSADCRSSIWLASFQLVYM